MNEAIPRIDNLPPDDPVALQGRATMNFLKELFDMFNVIPVDCLRELSQLSTKLMFSGTVPVALGNLSHACVVERKTGEKFVAVPLSFSGTELQVFAEVISLFSYAKDFYNDKLDEGTKPRARAYIAEFARECIASEWGPAKDCLKLLEDYPKGLQSLDEKYRYESKPFERKVSSIFDKFPKHDPSLN